jgi:hypothetical protein
MWQNIRAYQIITKNPFPHINAELLLVSTQSKKLNLWMEAQQSYQQV